MKANYYYIPGRHWILRMVAERGHLEVLQYFVLEWGCQLSPGVAAAAASVGNLEMLKWVLASGCQMEASTARNAASNGHLDCLRLAAEHGATMDGKVASSAGEAARALRPPRDPGPDPPTSQPPAGTGSASGSRSRTARTWMPPSAAPRPVTGSWSSSNGCGPRRTARSTRARLGARPRAGTWRS